MSVVDTTNLARPTDAIRHLVAERIQARLDTVAAEMIKEVQAQIPEYARPLDPTYARTVRRAVEEVLRHLVGLLEHPDRTEEGWRELFQAAGAGELDRRRRRLLELLLADPPAAAAAVAAAAETARWRLPRRPAAVAIDGCSAEPTPPVLAPDILVSVDRAEPCLLVPDPQPRTRSLATALAGLRAAVGPAVATADAVKSLRWARDALALAGRGILPGDELIWCEDHLATLAVFRDQHLLTLLAARRLAPLDGLRASQRDLRTRFELEIALRADRARRLSTDDK